MKTSYLMMCVLFFTFATAADAASDGQTVRAASDPKATQLVERGEQQTMGDSLSAKVRMAIVRDQIERDLNFDLWQSKRDKALVKVLEPRKDKDTGSLRLNLNLWQYLPNVGRIVRIPPSMMLQSWMGSDFTNDDMIKTSSLARDYEHQFDGEETVRGEKVVKIVCLPKPDAPVVWGKVRIWMRPKDAVALREEFYSEHGELIKVMEGTDVKTFGSHTMAATLTMTPVKKPGAKTIMHFDEVSFDRPLTEKIFSQENLMHAGASL